MEHLDVSDLPEPVVRAIEAMVQALKGQFGQATPKGGSGRELPRWEGQVLGNLTREEIYDDRV